MDCLDTFSQNTMIVCTREGRTVYQCAACGKDQYRRTRVTAIQERLNNSGVFHADVLWMLDTITSLREELRKARRGQLQL